MAQTEAEAGAEAQYFKKIVNFAKEAINTIAPALSSQNKQVQSGNDKDGDSWNEHHFKPYKAPEPKPKKEATMNVSINKRLEQMAKNIKKQNEKEREK